MFIYYFYNLHTTVELWFNEYYEICCIIENTLFRQKIFLLVLSYLK